MKNEHNGGSGDPVVKVGLFTLKDVGDLVEEAYGGGVWNALRAALAVIGSLSLRERTSPVALIIEGPSGRGKSTVINMCQPIRRETQQILYRLDMFTPKSFVSHAASVPRAKMEEIDLLPKLKDKVLLTKELASLFRGTENDLRGNFATLTAVLDGKGHISASGVHGTRGYDEKIIFNWIGGTTPIPARTDEIMGQMGNRLLRWEISGEEQSEEELVAFATDLDAASNEDLCREAVDCFLTDYFRLHPVNSVDAKTILTTSEMAKGIVRFAQLLASARVEVTRVGGTTGVDGEDFMAFSAPEGAHRIVYSFLSLVRGLALSDARTEVTECDVEMIGHVAFSSIPVHRRRVLKSVVAHGGKLYSEQAEKDLKVSRPTARGWMRELAATGIVCWVKSNGNAGESVTLEQKWRWLLADAQAESCIEDQDYSENAVAGSENGVKGNGFYIQRARGSHDEHHDDSK